MSTKIFAFYSFCFDRINRYNNDNYIIRFGASVKTTNRQLKWYKSSIIRDVNSGCYTNIYQMMEKY